MITSPRVLLFLTYFLIGLFSAAQAQLPVRGTRWKGVVLAPVKGQVTLVFQRDTLLILSEGTSVTPEVLRYQQAGDTLTIQKITGQSLCNDTITGIYKLVYSNSGETIALQTIADDCQERQNILTSNTPFVHQRSSQNQPLRNWPYLDPTADSVAGISLYRAYDLLKNRKSVLVIVGVLDSGVDIAHVSD